MDDYSEEWTSFNVSTTGAAINDTINATIGPDTGGTTAATPGYCGQDFKAFGEDYSNIHGYTSLIVCVFGALANILNLIVLTRKEMINPTNAILTGLALADLLNMLEYIPFAIYMNFLPDDNGTQRKTYGWALFVLMHSNFSQVCHTISIWLTLTLAVWRYVMVAMPLKCKTLCSMERAKWAICSAYLASPLLCIPIYLTFSIRTISASALAKGSSSSSADNNSTSNGMESSSPYSETNYFTSTSTPPPITSTMAPSSPQDVKYIVHLSDLAKEYPFLMTGNFWLYSVVIKIIPCILLTVVSFRLINSLMEAKKRKDKLLANKRAGAAAAARNNAGGAGAGNHAGSPAVGGRVGAGAGPNNKASEDGSGGSDRTTRMLLAVLLLFLITEFPQGLLALLSGLLGDAFFKSCYIPLSDLMDIVALLNSAINFILYCSMSKKFRDTFYKVFHLDEMAKLWWSRRRRAGGSGNGGGHVRPRGRASINNHISSPSANRSLLGNHHHVDDGKNHEAATAV